MSEKEQSDSGHIKKQGSLRVIKWVSLIAAGVVLLFFIGTPLFLSSSGGTNLLLGKINSSVDGQVQMEDLSVGWFRGVRLTNLLYTDTAGLTSVKVQSFQTRPNYSALLGGKVQLGKTVIQSPRVDIKVPPKGAVEVTQTGSTPSKAASTPFVLPINQMDLELRDGQVTIEFPGDMPQKVSFTNIASTVSLSDAGQNSRIDLSMQVADGAQSGQIDAKGNVAADKNWTLKKGDFDVTISKLQLESLKPLFALAGQEQMDMAGQLNADATLRISDNTVQQIKADATITNFAQGSGDQRIVFEDPVSVSALVTGSGRQMKIEKLVVDSQFCNVDCSGTTESLNYKVDADLTQTMRLVNQFKPVDLGFGGMLTANGNLKLVEDTVAVAGKGSFTGLTVGNKSVKTDPMNASLDYDVSMDNANKLLQVRSANMSSTSLGTLRVQNMRLPMGQEAAGQIALNADADLDLQKTLSLAQVFVPKLAENQISGQLKAAAKIETTGSQIRFQTQQASVDNLKIARQGAEPFVQDRVTLQGDVVVDTEEKTIDVRTLDLQGTQGETLIKVTKGKIEKNVTQNETKVKGDFEAEYDWKTVSALAPVSGLTVKGKRKDAFTFQSTYANDKPDQMLANLDAGGKIGFDGASYFGLNFGPTEMNMNIQKGLVNITIPQTTVNDGTMQFAGSIDLKEEPMFLRLKNAQPVLDKININDTVTSEFLAYTNPMFAGALRTSGIASVSFDELVIPLSKEDVNLAKIDGKLAIDSMSMRPGPFLNQFLTVLQLFKVDTASFGADITVMPTEFLLNKGVLSYDSMKIVMSDRQFDFSGKIGLDESLNMSVALPWTITGDSIAPGEQSKTAVRIPIGGTLKKPEFSTENLIRQQGEELIRDQIRRGLEGLFN